MTFQLLSLLFGVDSFTRRKAKISLLHLQVYLFLALNIADAALTMKGLALGAIETNPVMAPLLANGAIPFLVIKLSVGLIVGWASTVRGKESVLHYWEYAICYVGVLALYSWVVVHNLKIIAGRMG